jgi:hypothetical protein
MVIGRVGQSWARAGAGRVKTLATKTLAIANACKSPMLVAARGMIVPP